MTNSRYQSQKSFHTKRYSALLASSPAIGGRDQKRLLDAALRAYENASIARPDAPEPHFRAGLILRNFFVECQQMMVTCSRGHAASLSEAVRP